MFKVSRGRTWILAAIVVCVACLPLIASADGIGSPDPPVGNPTQIEELQSEGSSQELSDLEILALSLYLYLI